MRHALLCLGLVLLLPATAFAGPHDGLPELSSPPDRSTPRAAVAFFLREARASEHLRAAYALDLRSVPNAQQPRRGPELARQLEDVLDHGTRVDVTTLPDVPEGDEAGPTDVVTIGELHLRGERVPITLRRVEGSGGSFIWVFSQTLVDRVPDLYATIEPAPIERILPASFSSIRFGGLALWQWLGVVLFALVAWVVGLLLAGATLRLGRQVAARTEAQWDDRLMEKLRGPTRSVIALVVFWALLRQLHLPLLVEDVILIGVRLAAIAAGGWVAARVVAFVADTVEAHAVARADKEGDPVKARTLRTQARVFQRVANVVVAIVTVSLMLLQFDVVRTLGLSLLASAGIAGVVLGIAAQRSIAGLLAGIQLSITQPIRIGDVVIVEGEWGTIEEINLTYVVVKVWDERRLVVPISRFLESSFQNWTRVSPELHGTVFLYADYRVPVDTVRAELDRILDGHAKWDGRAKGLVVTDATERTVQLRATVTAEDAGQLWALRCDVREKLVAFLRDHEGGRYLPRTRIDLPAEGIREETV